MTTKAKSTQKTKLEVSLTGTGTFTKITGATSIPRGTASAQWTDVTDFDTEKDKEYISALSDVSDVTITAFRVVDDAGQNIVRDAYYANPRPRLYFKATTAQGEVFTFDSEVASFSITGDTNAAEIFNAVIRPGHEVYAGPDAQAGG